MTATAISAIIMVNLKNRQINSDSNVCLCICMRVFFCYVSLHSTLKLRIFLVAFSSLAESLIILYIFNFFLFISSSSFWLFYAIVPIYYTVYTVSHVRDKKQSLYIHTSTKNTFGDWNWN